MASFSHFKEIDARKWSIDYSIRYIMDFIERGI